MAAGAAPGTELCPHCRRPFKRLRAHLPHCKAAPPPAPAPGTEPRPGTAPGPGTASGRGPASAPGSALGKSPQPSSTTAVPSAAPDPRPGPGAAPGARPGAPRSGSRAVRDVARSLDLHPEEVEDVPKMLQKGLKVVIERNRARVLREKEPRSRGERTEPGPAPHPPRRKTAQKSKSKESPSPGAVGKETGSSKGEKSGLKATKALQEPPESRNNLGDLQREGRDKFTAGEERVRLEVGAGSEPPASPFHPGTLHVSLTEAFRGLGTSKNQLGRRHGASEPAGRAPELPPARIQPKSSGSAAGLEWFPELYPDYEGLRIFPGKRFQQDVRITGETPGGGFAQGQQGPLGERPLLEVRLGELHTWISTCDFSPQGLLGAAQRAWSSYCAKYIHVRQGGPAGISMLLAGYCLLSYAWNYQHFKQHRWRKYH